MADRPNGVGAAAGVTDTENCLAKQEKGFENGWGGEDEVSQRYLFGGYAVDGWFYIDEISDKNVSDIDLIELMGGKEYLR